MPEAARFTATTSNRSAMSKSTTDDTWNIPAKKNTQENPPTSVENKDSIDATFVTSRT